MLKLTAGTSRYFEATFNPDEIKKKLDSDADREKMEGMKRVMAVSIIYNTYRAVFVITDDNGMINRLFLFFNFLRI
jgi:hypothetical protein